MPGLNKPSAFAADPVAAKLGDQSLKRQWKSLLGVVVVFALTASLCGSTALPLVRDFGPSEKIDAEILNTRIETTTGRRGRTTQNYVSYGLTGDGQRFRFRDKNLFKAVDAVPFPVIVERSTVTKQPRSLTANEQSYNRSRVLNVVSGILLLFGLAVMAVVVTKAFHAPYRWLAAVLMILILPAALSVSWALHTPEPPARYITG